ncbi:MAG: ABC transporter ATP-binding protein/permease [Clostridia bacterium]|nr:ABC transporter ATP-binding protein/permease [Clostridia bacterium]
MEKTMQGKTAKKVKPEKSHVYRILLQSVREYKNISILTPVIMVGEGVMEILIPYFMTFVLGEIQNMAEGGAINWNVIILYSVLMVVCALFALACGAIGGWLAAKASAGFARNLREDMYNNLQSYSFANIDNFSTASLITRITTDVTNVQQAYQMSIRMLVRAPVVFLMSIIMTLVLVPEMALVYIGAAIILGIVLAVCVVKVVPYFRTMFRKYDDLNRVVQEDLTGIRVVKSYVREKTEMDKMEYATDQVYKYSVKAEKFLTIMMPVSTLVLYICNILLLIMSANGIYGNWAFFDGIEPTEIQTLITYSAQILTSVTMIANTLNYIALSRGSMDRIVEVLNERTTLPKPENPVEKVLDGSIIFENVRFAYSQKAEVDVLRDINIRIESGETVGIIGATGSGKSSLVNLIPRLYDVTEGSVKVGGVDVRDYSLDVLRNKVAMVLQKNVLFSGSVAENLRWGDENATDEEIQEAARQACADDFIQAFPGGYDYDLGQGGVNVSGGQKQRLCIARALLKHPSVIIFDDSTSAVDTRTDATIRKNLAMYAPDTTKIIIAQRIASVQDADKIIVMDDGVVTAMGNHEELMERSEIYREVYESQVQGGDE